MSLHAIPTNYRGINFRSRLEAKYAAMFDQLRWRWDYEPIDLGGWIPDFAIQGVIPILVEIKPIFVLDDALSARIAGFIEKSLDVNKLEHKYEALICGATLPMMEMENAPGIGWLWENDWCCARVFECEKGYGLNHEYNSYRDRISGWYDGTSGAVADLRPMWAAATNSVQWRATNGPP
jgi:hypothetical protein